MIDLETARGAVARETADYLTTLRGLDADGWSAATRCAGWTLRDLAIHLVGVSDAHGTSLDRLRQGEQESPSIGRPELASATPQRILGDLEAGTVHLNAALQALDPDDLAGQCPLPLGLLPGAVALQIVVFEHGLHANDVRWALGDEAPLAPDVIRAAAGAMGAALPMLARLSPSRPDDGTFYRLRGDTVRLAYVAEGGAWRGAHDDDRTASAEAVGDDSAVMLFAMGRIPVTHPSVRIEGDAALLGRFKEFFPGP